MNTLRERARISFLPLLLAAVMVLLALGIMFAQAQMSDGGTGSGSISADLTTHQDGDGPPRCRPAGKYAGDPHPNHPSCKHKPAKH